MERVLYLLTRDPRFLDVTTLNRVSIECRFPSWIVFFLAIAAVFFAIYAYRRAKGLPPGRRRFLTFLRAVAYLALLFLLAAPALKIEGEGNQTGPLPVVVDRTESMGIDDVYKKPRLEAALGARSALLGNTGLEPALKQVHYLYGSTMELMNERQAESNNWSDVSGSHTSIRDMIMGGMKEHRGVYCPGILLLTDGANNVADLLDSSVDDLRKRRVPLYAVPIGQENPKDVSLEHIIGDDIVFVNEKAKFFVSITQNGYRGRPLKIKASLGAVPVSVPEFTPDKDGDLSFPVEFTPSEEGATELMVEVPPDSEESTDQNNKVSRKVRVIKEKIRILMIFGIPSWEFRYLDGAFGRDRRVKHKCFLQSVDRRIFKYEQSRIIEKLPSKPAELFPEYDMVILSRIDMAGLPESFHKMLHDFVSEEGGGLVILSDGADIPFSLKGTKLEPLLPVRLRAAVGASNFSQEMFKPLDTPYRFDITEDGQGNPLTTFDANRLQNKQIWMTFPPAFELVTPVEYKPSAIPLVNAFSTPDGPRYPAVAYHSYGKGTVLYMGFDSSWRWRKEHGDRYFRDYWGKVVQFLGLPHLLGESAQARLLLDRMSASIGERVVVTGSIRNRDYSPHVAESVTITYRPQNGTDKEFPLAAVPERPGIFRSTFYPDTEGKIVFRLPKEFPGEPVELTVTRLSREFQDSGVKVTLLTELAGRTGGEVFLQALAKSAAAPAAAKPTPLPPAPAVSALSFLDRLRGFLRGQHAITDPAAISRARVDRERELWELKQKIEKKNQNPFEDGSYLSLFAKHILKTIAEKRATVAILIEKDLWDTLGLLILTATVLCVEYLFRKLWYLD